MIDTITALLIACSNGRESCETFKVWLHKVEKCANKKQSKACPVIHEEGKESVAGICIYNVDSFIGECAKRIKM